ncbi:PilX N-terminal domain-containing pilus assembly protein [Thiocapsa roseopersicina]|uniref:PilX N-terminal n=1 Tax=Thiocapsa roseopersicina TaxID=1058 RepID=A0A1H2TVQ7_THIRO|nr:hypothetical protein [Thiocapsa roseopersicina]SDW47244.1 hypothetical protein SAMN05421783_104164 [Thiocapsa roseopersicina]
MTSRKIKQQRGALTLMLGLLLLMGSTILTLSSVRVGIMEQRIANNELRAKEAQQAAQAGLDYALARIAQGNNVDTPPPVTATGDATYDIVLTENERNNEICVLSRASARGDDSIEAVATECFQQQRLLKGGTGTGHAPLVLNGCLSGATGDPDIYPRDCTGVDEGEDCASVAITSSAEMSCLDTGHLDLHGGDIEDDDFTGSAWDQVFDISKDEFKAIADTGDPQFLWINSSSNWHQSLGSPAKPVYLVFSAAADCPKLNGNPTIYGIVYFENAAGCRSQGWGGATVYGTVVFDGDLNKLTANSRFYHWSRAGTDGERANLDRVRSASRIPGSWRDWD